MNENDPLVERLRDLGRQPVEPGVAGQHLGAMATVPGRHWSIKLKVGTAFFAGLLLGGTGLATAGALPAPAQDVAHSTLSVVGVSVPEGHQRFNDPKVCGTDPATGQPFRNHGQYVKAHKSDPNAGASPCGKPLQAGKPDTAGTTKGTEAPEKPETTETTEKPDSGTNPGKAGKANPGKGNKGQGDQGDQGTDNESPEPTDAPEPPESPEPTTPGAAAPKSVTTTAPPTTSTSSTSTSTTSTTLHG